MTSTAASRTGNPWRLVLRTGSISSRLRRIVPLSTWQEHGNPLEDESISLTPLVRKSAEVFGQVLAWASPESSSCWQSLTGTPDPEEDPSSLRNDGLSE
jgi:hypothetical protein